MTKIIAFILVIAFTFFSCTLFQPDKFRNDSPSAEPRFHRGDWALNRKTGLKVYVYYWQAEQEGGRQLVKYNVCTHGGRGAECWMVDEGDLEALAGAHE